MELKPDRGGNLSQLVMVDATASLSGGEVYLRNLLVQWSENHLPLRMEVLHLPESDLRELSAEWGEISFRVVRMPGVAQRVWLIGSIYKMLWRQLVLPLHLWRRRPAVLFSNSGMLPGLIPSGVRAVVAIHNSMPLQPELWRLEKSILRKLRLRLLRRQIRRLIRHRVEIVVFSKDLKDRLQLLGAKKDQCTVIRHGIEWGEQEQTRDLPSELQAIQPHGRPFLLYVSQLHRYKNVLNLLTAFARLRASRPDVDLVIVGHLTDRGYAREIRRRIDSTGLTPAVKIIPGLPRESLIGLYRRAIAIIYPSLAENCPFVLLEAMALGRPIVAANIPAIVETCDDAALYFDPSDPEEMCRQMEHILLDAGRRNTLSANAIRRAASLSWPVAAANTLGIILRLAHSRTPN